MADNFCEFCELHYGDAPYCDKSAGCKACVDPYNYLLGTKSGAVFYFTEMEVSGEWVHLRTRDLFDSGMLKPMMYPCGRGVSVRKSEIEWVVDSPSEE